MEDLQQSYSSIMILQHCTICYTLRLKAAIDHLQLLFPILFYLLARIIAPLSRHEIPNAE